MNVIIAHCYDCALSMLSTQVYGPNGKYLGTLGNVDFAMNPMWQPSLMLAAAPTPSCSAPIEYSNQPPHKHAPAY